MHQWFKMYFALNPRLKGIDSTCYAAQPLQPAQAESTKLSSWWILCQLRPKQFKNEHGRMFVRNHTQMELGDPKLHHKRLN